MYRLLVFLLPFLISLPAIAVVTSSEAYRLDRTGPVPRSVGLGSELANAGGGLGVKATYDIAKTAGAGTHALYWNGETVKLPDNAVISKCFFDVVTQPAGTGVEIAFSSEAASDLKGSTAAASWTGRVAAIPDGQVANMIKLTAERTLYAVVSATAVSAGKINLFCEYALSD